MKLTIKNIGRELLSDSTVNECPMCGDDAQICAYKNKDGQQIEIFCESCGAKMDFVEYLVDLEKREEVKKEQDQVEKDLDILRAISLLNENDYIVRKLTDQQEKDCDECGESDGNKDCMECSCNGCIFD
jgi:hypothetical protein